MNPFDIIYKIEKNGKVFLLHWKYRFDPLTLSLAAAGAGTAVSIAGTLQQGKQAEEIANERAAIDEKNAAAVRDASVEAATIKGERGRRLLAAQKSQAAAGGIRINVGSPLVIAAETRAAIAKDIGFGLERGRAEEEALLSSAALERRTGEQIRKRSVFNAISQGLSGFGSIAFMGTQAGIFKKTTAPTRAIASTRATSPSAGFGIPTRTGGFLT